MLQFHLNRLWESAEATGLGPAARAEGRESLERRTTETIARVMESFWEGEFKAQILQRVSSRMAGEDRSAPVWCSLFLLTLTKTALHFGLTTARFVQNTKAWKTAALSA